MIQTFESNGRARNLRPTGGVLLGRLDAYVNHGRWVVDCPAAGCAGAELASDVRPFVCASCGEGPYQTRFPTERAAIEAALESRPVEAQNWLPGETVADLEAENEVNG